MRYTFKPRHNTHDNDCWCDAIALLTNQDYDVVYKLFKPFINDDGTLNTLFTKGYLSKLDYCLYEISGTLYEWIQIVNNKNGVIFELENDNGGHTIYVKDNVIYDNIKKVATMQYFTDHNITGIWLKIDDEFKKL